MDESKKNLLVTLEGASGLYGDLRGRILEVESGLGAEIEGLNESLKGYITTSSLEAGLATKADTSYVNTELDKKANKSDLTTALIYKGSVDNYSSLPSNAATGDVYNVKNANGEIPAGTNYAWTGTEWDALGGTVSVDLSTYATKEALESGLAAKQDTITGAASSITDSNLTTGRVLVSNSSGKVSTSTTTATEIFYLKGVTSSVQDQLDSKAPTTHGIHVGDVPLNGPPSTNMFLKVSNINPMEYVFDELDPDALGITANINGILTQLEAKANKSDLGDAAYKNVGTLVDTVAAGNHTHSNASTSAAGFMSAADKTSLNTAVADISTIKTALAGKSDTGHNHDGVYLGKNEQASSAASAEVANKLSTTNKGSSSKPVYFNGSGVPDVITSLDLGTGSINAGTITGTAVYGAVWNDLTDSIEVPEDTNLEPGYAYCFDGERYYKSTKYMDEGFIGIHSDTSGFSMGKKGNGKELDVAVAGFVLAYVDRVYRPGTPLTATTDGKLTEMSLQDKIYYPERIVGTFWKVEVAEEWGSEDRKVPVNGRCWIKVR